MTNWEECARSMWHQRVVLDGPPGKAGLQDGGSSRQPSPRWRTSRILHCGLHGTIRKLELSTQELPNWEPPITGFPHPMPSVPYLIWTQACALPQPDKRTPPTPSQPDFPDWLCLSLPLSLPSPLLFRVVESRPKVLAIKFISRISLPRSLFSYTASGSNFTVILGETNIPVEN